MTDAPAPLDAPLDVTWAIADRYVDAYVALDPYAATYAGIAGHDRDVTDFSPDGVAARADLAARTLRELDGVAPQTERERVAQEAMRERLGLEVEFAAADAGLDLNVCESPLVAARQTFDLLPTENPDDWAAVAARLHRTGESMTSYRRLLDVRTSRGVGPARRQVLGCAAQCEEWAAGYFPDLAHRADTSGRAGSAAGDVSAGAAAAAEACRETARWLREELTGRARERDAVGRERYALASRAFLGATVDLDQTYSWGWEELARLRSEMVATAARVVPGGTLEEATAALDADPGRGIAGAAPFRDWMQALADRAVDELGGTHFDIPEPLRTIECRIADTHEGSIYYTAPSEDFSRPGRMWWAVPPGVERFSTWRETSTVYHEGVPGHHLQVGQTVLRRDRLNRWQRLLCEVHGHAEGWALYAERLMEELGYLDDAGDRLGMLDLQLLRAARVVLDIGMHLELAVPAGFDLPAGEVLGPDLGWRLLRANSQHEEPFLRFELERYLGWPGQAAAYKVGERVWRELRSDEERRRGAAFDLTAFHRDALGLGVLGLDPLREAMARR